jgi:hypothetical protein
MMAQRLGYEAFIQEGSARDGQDWRREEIQSEDRSGAREREARRQTATVSAVLTLSRQVASILAEDRALYLWLQSFRFLTPTVGPSAIIQKTPHKYLHPDRCKPFQLALYIHAYTGFADF